MRTRVFGGLAVLALALMLGAATAAGASVTVNCLGLQPALNAATSGEVVTLDQLCESGFPYKLPAVPITLAGTPGSGFKGGGPQVEAGGASATIEGLLFENATTSAPNAAAGLNVNTGGQPFEYVLRGDSFTGDSSTSTLSAGGGARLNTSEGVVTVAGSTFSGDSANAGGGIYISADRATLVGDSFVSDTTTANGSGGGLVADLQRPGSVLSGSTFEGDTATDQGGGASFTLMTGAGTAMTIEGNRFLRDRVADPAGASTDVYGYSGGGLAIEDFGIEPTGVLQRGNLFEGNSVTFKPAAVTGAGGGEAVNGVTLQSSGDRFIGNGLQSPDASEDALHHRTWGWGAGVSIIACGDSERFPAAGPNLRSVLAGDVIAANVLLSGPGGGGAGIYVGSSACYSSYAELVLTDSTVSGNQVQGAAGPVAGISGGPHDVLSLANTVLAGDGGPEIGGFNALAGVSSVYSDVCSGAAPFAGTGNICADPQLAGAATGDVHELASSPTIEKGSNSLVPAGLLTDIYGGPRILGPLGCGSEPPAIVDIGAAEYAHPAPPCVPPLGPVLSGLHQSASRWRAGKAAARISSAGDARAKRPPVGTTFSFMLDQAASVTLTFTRSAAGRRVGGKCLAPGKRNRRRRHCSRTIVAGVLTLKAHAGTDKVRFDGVISRHTRLAASNYTLRARALGGGPTSTLRFTIVR